MNVDLSDLRRLERAFEKVRQELTTASGGIAERIETGMGRHDAGQNRQVFKREVDPNTGARWAALSPSYSKWKRANSSSRKKLVLSGGLKKSLTTKGSPDRVAQLRDMVMTLGTSNPLGAKHMQGEGRMPARPMVGKTPRQLRSLAAIVRQQVLDGVGRAMGGPFGRGLIESAGRIKPDPRRF